MIIMMYSVLELPLLAYLLQRAMEEHPDSHELQVITVAHVGKC